MEIARVCTALIFVLCITAAAVASTANAVVFKYARSTMEEASENNSWWLYGQTSAWDRKPVEAVTSAVVEHVAGGRVASTRNIQIDVSAAFMAAYRGILKFQVAGVIFQEVASVYAPRNWVKPGEGSTWNKEEGVTARFLDFLDEQQPGLVAEINSAMKKAVGEGPTPAEPRSNSGLNIRRRVRPEM
ncbi:hypothetical protein ACP70R_022731 [Stipagrostis hirtigluma subsp. patula]